MVRMAWGMVRKAKGLMPELESWEVKLDLKAESQCWEVKPQLKGQDTLYPCGDQVQIPLILL